jgi:hypothetical protein
MRWQSRERQCLLARIVPRIININGLYKGSLDDILPAIKTLVLRVLSPLAKGF